MSQGFLGRKFKVRISPFEGNKNSWTHSNTAGQSLYQGSRWRSQEKEKELGLWNRKKEDEMP